MYEIRSRRIGVNVVLNCGPHVFRSFWVAVFSDNKIAPLMDEGGVCSGESLRDFKAIGVYLAVEGLEGCAKYCAGVEVDR